MSETIVLEPSKSTNATMLQVWQALLSERVGMWWEGPHGESGTGVYLVGIPFWFPFLFSVKRSIWSKHSLRLLHDVFCDTPIILWDGLTLAVLRAQNRIKSLAVNWEFKGKHRTDHLSLEELFALNKKFRVNVKCGEGDIVGCKDVGMALYLYGNIIWC